MTCMASWQTSKQRSPGSARAGVPALTLAPLMGLANSRGSWVVGRMSWVVGKKSWVVGKKSWVVGKKSWVVGKKSWVPNKKSWFPSKMFPHSYLFPFGMRVFSEASQMYVERIKDLRVVDIDRSVYK